MGLRSWGAGGRREAEARGPTAERVVRKASLGSGAEEEDRTGAGHPTEAATMMDKEAGGPFS